jgi:competence protein ComEA
MSVLKSKAGFLTKEERLVFLTVSFCLLLGGVFHMVYSFFDLPDAIDPAEKPSPSPSSGSRVETQTPGPQARARDDSAEWDLGESAYEPVLAPALEDGVAVRGERPAPNPDNRRPSSMLELNGASQAELEELPGIGPALASRIVQHRKRVGGFRTVDDLLDVRGIGEKTLSRFRSYVYVSRAR